jgi:hypothetical protein
MSLARSPTYSKLSFFLTRELKRSVLTRSSAALVPVVLKVSKVVIGSESEIVIGTSGLEVEPELELHEVKVKKLKIMTEIKIT